MFLPLFQTVLLQQALKCYLDREDKPHETSNEPVHSPANTGHQAVGLSASLSTSQPKTPPLAFPLSHILGTLEFQSGYIWAV